MTSLLQRSLGTARYLVVVPLLLLDLEDDY